MICHSRPKPTRGEAAYVQYTINYEQAIDYSFAQELGITEISGEITQKSSYYVQIFSDFKNEKTFWSRKNTDMIFESNGNKITKENLSSSDVNSIASKKDFVFSNDMEKLQTIPELPNFPGTEDKRVAWREPPEDTFKRGITELINPKEYFDWREWGNIDRVASENIHLFEAVDESGTKWFRLYQQLTSQSGNKRDLNIFWNEDAGLHPVCSLYVDNGTRILKDLIQIKWKKVDDIFIPVESLDVVYENSGKLSYRRRMLINDTKINKPISPQQFSYSAIGLEDGDILVDRIKQQVFTIKNDKPVFLAKFYEKYQTPRERGINRFRLVIMGLGVAMIVCGIYLKIRRKKTENSA